MWNLETFGARNNHQDKQGNKEIMWTNGSLAPMSPFFFEKIEYGISKF
jgi:hypothetical protein